MSCRLGAHLTIEVNLNTAVYGHKVLYLRHRSNVVYIVYRSVATDRVVVYEVIKPLGSTCEGVNCLAFVDRLVSRQLSCIEKIHICIRKHLCVRINVSLIRFRQHGADTQRQTPDTQLQCAVAPDSRHNVACYLLIYLRRFLGRKLSQRRVASLYHIIDPVKVKLCLISVGNRHLFVNLNYYFLCRLDYTPHVGNLRTQIEVAVLVHRRNLKHGDVYLAVVVYPQERQFAEHHRYVPAAPVLVHPAVMSVKMSRRKTHLLVAVRGKIGFKRSFSDAYCADYFNISQIPGSFSEGFVNINNRPAAQTEMNSVSVLYHFCRLVSGYKLFLIFAC